MRHARAVNCRKKKPSAQPASAVLAQGEELPFPCRLSIGGLVWCMATTRYKKGLVWNSPPHVPAQVKSENWSFVGCLALHRVLPLLAHVFINYEYCSCGLEAQPQI